MNEITCECPEKAVRVAAADFFGYAPEEEKAREHEPNQCPGDYNLQLYQRGKTRLWLCSCCWSPSDWPLSRTEAPR